MNKSQLINFLVPKIKYGISSLIATSVDYFIFFALVSISAPEIFPLIQAFAYACGVLTNFILRKRFVFTLKRTVSKAFSLSLSFSLFGMLISSIFMFLLTKLPYFIEYLLLTKLLITSLLLIYNFYANRFAFEKKGLFNSLGKDTNQTTEFND